MSETMNLHRVPETVTLHRAPWTGPVISAFVVIALVADGTVQLFAPAQIASMLQETGFAMEVTRVVGPIILACAILYAIPATAVLGAILMTGFLGGGHLRPCPHWRVGVAAGNHFPASWCDDMGRPLRARSPYPGHSAAYPLNRQGQCSVPQDQEKTQALSNGIHGKSWRRNGGASVGARQEMRPLVHNREKASNWADQGVELTGGGWNDQAAIEQPLKGVEGAFVMWPSVWARSPRLQRKPRARLRTMSRRSPRQRRRGLKRHRRWVRTGPAGLG